MTLQQPSIMFAASLLALGLLATTGASAQVKRTPVLTADVAAPGHQAVVVRGEIDPGASAPRHSHPGDEISYVLEGEAELLIDGEPPRMVKAGEAFVVPAGKVHGARNPGAASLRFVGVYVVEKGKPLAAPAK
ncbi:cupin domain-containing protein [Massilia sp. R2A-15]|uniref:cupin domain-containing protein n=1 Tax=Massilia sp. R2A-15 TaxID=3064278 RepID=UPI002733F37A|nr:cupin domain-containing protein [Massilia sp. R2A-15]WLI89219.1 cupin domain-containing protein [Massilia sp. R2A-15]